MISKMDEMYVKHIQLKCKAFSVSYFTTYHLLPELD